LFAETASFRTAVFASEHRRQSSFSSVAFLKEMKRAIEMCRLYQIKVHMAMIEQVFPCLILMP
jgi:hypothetical protein